MRLGFIVGYSGSKIELPVNLVLEADKLGYFAVWTAEAYGSDAITPLAWLGAQTKQIHLGTAIMQIPARTPAMTAMTAMTLDQLSGGRFLLGLGVSGPQVVEGWHGQPFGRPLEKTREYVSILRKIFKRESRLEHKGMHYQIPYQGVDASGLGKPLKSILHGRSDIPIYLAAIGPKNVELVAEIGDGWLPIFFSPRFFKFVFEEQLRRGFSRAGNGKGVESFDVAPSVPVVLGDDLEVCWNMLKPMLALYIGGMGAKEKNFYYNLACRFGYEGAADQIQNFYLSGKKAEAVGAVPDGLVDEISLCGPRKRIQERLEVWKQSPIKTLNVMTHSMEVIRLMAELVL